MKEFNFDSLSLALIKQFSTQNKQRYFDVVKIENNTAYSLKGV